MTETVKVEIQSRKSGPRRLSRPRNRATTRLKSERVEVMLKAMPEWSLSKEGTAIQSTRSFPSARVASLFAGIAAEYAAGRGQAVQLTVAGRQVVVKLPGAPKKYGRFGGITEMVFVLAQQLVG